MVLTFERAEARVLAATCPADQELVVVSALILANERVRVAADTGSCLRRAC
jgi:hypothetical protein